MNTVDSEEVITYVKLLEGAVRPALAPLDYQPENQQEPEPQEGEGQGDGEGEEESDGEGEGEGEGEPEESEGEPEPQQSNSDSEDGSKTINTEVLEKTDLFLTYKNAYYVNLQNDHNDADIASQVETYLADRQGFLNELKTLLARTKNQYSVGQIIAAIGVQQLRYQHVPLANVLTRRDIEEVLGGSISDKCVDPEEKHVDAPEDIGFALQLRNVMTDNRYDRMLSGRRRGTLDGNMLYKVPTGDMKAFKKKESRQNKDYNFTLLVDQSGSMEGHECREAADLGVSLYKSFERAKINYSCYGYSDTTARYKRFEDHLDPDALYSMLLWNANGNNEYPALVDSYSRFPRASRSNNFVILLSDGGIDSSQQDKMVEFCQQNARVATLIGLGIGEGSRPMPFCDIDIQRDTIPEAKKELLRQLRNVIRRG